MNADSMDRVDIIVLCPLPADSEDMVTRFRRY